MTEALAIPERYNAWLFDVFFPGSVYALYQRLSQM
jgi:hypothetical protein